MSECPNVIGGENNRLLSANFPTCHLPILELSTKTPSEGLFFPTFFAGKYATVSFIGVSRRDGRIARSFIIRKVKRYVNIYNNECDN